MPHPSRLSVFDIFAKLEQERAAKAASTEPIEWMIRADWAMKSGEVTQAQNYRNQAMNWLKAHEVTDDTIQTQVVVNSVYAGSMGEISEEADNI